MSFVLGLMTGLVLAAVTFWAVRSFVYHHWELVLWAGLRKAEPRMRVVALQTLMNEWCPLCGEAVTPQTECDKLHLIPVPKPQPEVN